MLTHFSSRPSITVVAQSSTCRRHIQFKHKGVYIKWCHANQFESKLPKDVKARKEEAARKAKPAQSTLDTHLEDRPHREAPYSDNIFEQAALEWLIATDQVRSSHISTSLLP